MTTTSRAPTGLGLAGLACSAWGCVATDNLVPVARINGGDTAWSITATALVSEHPAVPSVPESVYLLFQLSFAVITPALIVGAVAERMRFAALSWFIGLWSLVVYAPIAQWVWGPGGWLANLGALDFAGGTVVHQNAGVAGLVAAWWLKPRLGHGQVAMKPSNLGYTLIGASLATQALAGAATLAHSGLATAAVLWLVSQLLALRITPEHESLGLDWSQHAE